MPKKAFLNLNMEKRSRISETAMRLFVDHPYEQLTVTQIIKNLSLHPTTFYRYFDNKEELYCYLLQSIAQKRSMTLSSIRDQRSDFFYYDDRLSDNELTELEIRFVGTAKRLPVDVLQHMYMNVFLDETVSLHKSRLRLMRYDGKLRPDIDDDLIAYIGATIPFNIIMFGRAAGIEDDALLSKLNRYFFENFFLHGLMPDEVFSSQENLK